MKAKDFVVKDSAGFRLRIKSWECLAPKNYNAVEFIQEVKDEDGNIEQTSTYQFFLTDEEMISLAEGLLR